MEKIYCVHCRTIHSEVKFCEQCGSSKFQKITIEVQQHKPVQK